MNELDDYEYNYTNYTDYLSDYELDTSVSYPVEVLSMVLYSITFVLGVPGNGIVIWITGLKMKRTVNTTWFLNLAIADFICCLSLPFSVVNIALNYHWPYGNALCKVIPSVIVLNMFASVFILTLVSVDRCTLVTKPVWSQNNRTVWLANLLCGIVWLLAVIMCLPTLIYREIWVENNITICNYGDHEDTVGIERVLHSTRLIFGFFIPFVTITTCYSLITLKVRRSQFSKSSKTLKIILAVIVSFFICWIPYHVIGVLHSFAAPMSDLANTVQILDPLVICLAYINSCLNPLLYVFMGQDFKDKIRTSLRNILESAFSEDVTRSTLHSKARSSRDETAT
ncbi:UNVERIFIED_CONTAM: hypothetical protein FKN15_001294 [Acipenser sinensis]